MTIDLLAQLGDDLTIVNAARVSFHREVTRTAAGTLTLADQRLIATRSHQTGDDEIRQSRHQ